MHAKKPILARLENNVIWLGLFLCAAYWVLESTIYVYIFNEGSLSGQIFSPSSKGIWTRTLVSLILISSSGLVHSIICRRKQAEEALRKNEQFLQDIFDGIQDGISALDANLHIIRVNAWMEKMYADHMPFLGKKCYAIYQNRKSPCPWCPCLKALDTGKMHTELVPYPSAEKPTGWIELSAYPLKDPNNRTVGIIEHVRDVTAQKQASDKLQKSEAKTRAIINAIPDLMFQLDKNGTFLGYKGAREDLYVEENAFLGKNIVDVMPPNIAAQAKQYINRTLATGDIQIFEYQLKIHDRLRDFESRMSPSGDNEVVAIIRDITESKKPPQLSKDEEVVHEEQAS